MEDAARKIQATYRGHSVRQSLHSWQLSTGRTLYQTLEEARLRAFVQDLRQDTPICLASDHYLPVRIPSVLPSPELSSVRHSSRLSSKQQLSKSPDSALSVASLVSEALESSKLSLEDAERSKSSISKRKNYSKVCIMFQAEVFSFFKMLCLKYILF